MVEVRRACECLAKNGSSRFVIVCQNRWFLASAVERSSDSCARNAESRLGAVGGHGSPRARSPNELHFDYPVRIICKASRALLLLALLPLPIACRAPAPTNGMAIAGDWEGVVLLPQIRRNFVISLSRRGEKISGTIDIPSTISTWRGIDGSEVCGQQLGVQLVVEDERRLAIPRKA